MSVDIIARSVFGHQYHLSLFGSLGLYCNFTLWTHSSVDDKNISYALCLKLRNNGRSYNMINLATKVDILGCRKLSNSSIKVLSFDIDGTAWFEQSNVYKLWLEHVETLN